MKNQNTKADLVDYINFTKTTWNSKPNPVQNVQHAILGLMDECGEIAGWHKKVVGYDKPFQPDQVILELGDYMFYLIRFCEELSLFDNRAFLEMVEIELNSSSAIIDKKLTRTDYCMNLFKATTLLIDSFNKFDVKKQLLDVIVLLRIHARLCGTNLPNVIKANVAKLTERHIKVSGGYNPDNLTTRDRDAELKAATGAIKPATSENS